MDRDGERAYAARPGVGGGRGWPKRLILTSDMCNFGREAEDSPMVAGSAIGTGDTAEEAIDGVVSDLKLEIAPSNGGVAPELQKAADEGMGC